MRSSRPFAVFLLFLLCALGAACGAGPAAPSGQEVVLRGTVSGLASGGGASAQSLGAAAASTITVTLEGNPAITTVVSPDGSFVLRGLAPGAFTLVFSADGREIGRLTFASVLPNQQITIVVDVANNTVTLLDEKRTGIGHGDVEIEGVIEKVVLLNEAGESQFRVTGYLVVARPGKVAIREGNVARTVRDLTVGRRVHVKGVFDLSIDAVDQHILATEIVLQDATGNTEPGGGGQACMINGGTAGQGIELEGTVADGGATSFHLQVNGNRARQPVQVDAGGAAFECHPSSGPNAVPADQCRAQVKGGTQVHVSGLLASCDSQAARVTASKVIVQK